MRVVGLAEALIFIFCGLQDSLELHWGSYYIILCINFSLTVLEVRMWLDITRLVIARWETGEKETFIENNRKVKIDTLWTNDDVPSVEVHNYVY